MKKQIRAIAFDDGKFAFRKGRVPIVGVIARLPSYLEGAIVTDCEIDGNDATQRIVDAVSGSRMRAQIRVILLDGIACGGFNLYDLETIHAATGVPVISVTRAEPHLGKMERALRKHFADWEERLHILRKYMPRPLKTEDFTIQARMEGLAEAEARELVRASIVRGNYPEPLRMAHIIAGAITSGESRGKA